MRAIKSGADAIDVARRSDESYLDQCRLKLFIAAP